MAVGAGFVMTICCIMGKYSKEPFTFVREERNKKRKMKRNIMETNIISELTTFIEHAPTAFHAVAELKDPEAGRIRRIKRVRKVEGQTGKRYYVTRNNSSIIAVKAGKELTNY